MAIVTPYVYSPNNTGGNVYQLNTSDGAYVASRTVTAAIGSHVDLNGYLWTVDTLGNLNRLSLDLNFLNTYSIGVAAFHCCQDKDGKVWTANGGAGTGNTVTKFDTDGTVLATYTVQTFAYSICADCNGYIWVSNSASDSISRITVSDGTVANYSLGAGTTPKQLCADLDGNIWVACLGSNNVKKVQGSDGSVLATYTTVATAGCFGIALDSSNNVWVSNITQNSLTKLNSAGTVVTTVGAVASPAGVCVDASDNIWVACNGSSVIRKYANDGSGGTAYVTGASPVFPDTGYMYQHFVLKSDAPVPSTFVPRIIFM